MVKQVNQQVAIAVGRKRCERNHEQSDWLREPDQVTVIDSIESIPQLRRRFDGM
jgi:hypothetical protein